MWADEMWLRETYDRVVQRAGEDGATFAEIREAIAEEYEQAIEAGALERAQPDVHDEGLSLFDKFALKIRRDRRADMQKNMDWIVWALDDPEVSGAYEDSCLALAYPMGDGRDKTLRLWSNEDWNTATMTRYRKAAEATAAASAFDDRAQQITSAMSARGARITGDLFRD